MSFDFQRSMHSFSLYSLYDICRRYQRNIFEKYHDAWNAIEYFENKILIGFNKSIIRSCEQEIIKLDKIELQNSLHQLITNELLNPYYISKEIACVLFHLINVFCTPGQVKKMRVVQVKLNEVLHTMTERDRFHIFEKYISQRLKAKPNLIEIDFLTGQIDPHHEFQFKLCNWDIVCAKRTDEGCKEFLQQNVDYLVSNIEGEVRGIPSKFLETEKTKLITCTMLLCLLNWNICKTQHQVILQIMEAPATFTSAALVAYTSTNYSFTAYKVSRILQNILSTFSEDEIFTAFNNYINKMYAMKSDLTEDDLCTDKIGPYFEFILKLCYWDYLCIKNDFKRCKEFSRKNTDLFVSQIEELVSGNKTNTKAKLVSCKLLLCLLNWNICNLEPFIGSHILNSEKQQSCTMYKVRCLLENLLSTLTDDDISEVINGYIDQMHTMKLEITPDGLCIGVAVLHHEFKLKQIYFETIYRKNDYEALKKIIQLCLDILVSHIEKQILYIGGKKSSFFCKTLLFILNWNICTLKTVPPMVQKTEIQTTVADSQPKYSPTEETVRSLLQNYLLTFSEKEIFITFNDYLEQINTMKSDITEDDFCTGKIEPYHEFMLKLCYCEKLCNTINGFEAYREFLTKNADLFVPQIEKVVHGKNKYTKLVSCKILLCLLNWNIYNLKSTFIQSEIQNSAYKVRSILQKLLSTLSEVEILTAFNDYLNQMYTMNSEITEDDFCTGKIEPYHEFVLKICYCTKKWSKTKVDFITRNTELFLSMVEEVNKRNQLRMKFKMCQVLNLIMIGKICIKNCKDDAVEALMMMDRNLLPETNNNKKTENAFQMIACILLLKTKLDNLSNHTVKMLIQYKDHIKELLISLLAIMLTKISTSQINEAFYLAFYLYNETCVPNTTIQLELAKTFLDISLNPKISQHRKSIIEDNIKSLLISHDSSKTVLPPTTDIINYACKKLDHKRMINICINIVKTKSKGINISMYEGLFCSEKKAIENEVEMVKRSQETETLVLLMLLLITITSTGHHKSAKLKKYLTLKYEYATASLYLLWCSGDIEVHPGPSLNKKTLAHDSSIERRWIQNIIPKIINRLPEHEQSKYKRTKKVRNDRENREHFKTLLKTCLEEKIHVPKMYLAEINAWETMEYTIKLRMEMGNVSKRQQPDQIKNNSRGSPTGLQCSEKFSHPEASFSWPLNKYILSTLHKLFVYRCEIETIIASLQDFFICGGSTKDLTDINVSLDTELKTNDITTILGKDHRPTDKSQLMVYITRHIAGISIKCAHGKDPDAKWDGLWDLPLKNWPNDIILFDPNNRGKYTIPGQKLIPDLELVDILLTLPQVTIPQKYKDIVDAFRTMRKSKKDKSINKQHKAELCSTFKRITSLEKLDYALKNLWESGIFTEEVHTNLNKWWTTGAVDTTDNQNLSQVDIKDAEKKRRPHILMNISTKSLTLTVEQSDANSSQVSYDFPFSDQCVPLKTMATNVHQTTIHKPSSDSCQMVNAKIHLTVSPKPDACSADNQINLIIIPPDEMIALNSGLPYDLYPIRQKILESDVKHQHDMSSHETAVWSTIHFVKPTSSTNKIRQLNQDIAISGQPGPILCTPNQSTTNSNDISSATKDSQNPDFHMQVSTTSDIGSSDSISSVNSESGNDDGDQNNISNGSQVILTDSDYSSDSSNNSVSKSNMKKRKCMEEDRNEMKKRKVPSLKQDKKPKETNHRKDDSSMDKSTIFNINMELVQDYLQIDLDSFDFDDQTFDVKLNALDNEDKNREICDKDGNLMNCETQMSNENTNISAYNTSVSTILEKFVKDMINEEHEKMSQMKTSFSEV